MEVAVPGAFLSATATAPTGVAPSVPGEDLARAGELTAAQLISSLAPEVGGYDANLPAALSTAVSDVGFAGPTGISRIFGHVAWADSQLSHMSPRAEASVAAPGYVYTAPAEAERARSIAASVPSAQRPAMSESAPGALPMVASPIDVSVQSAVDAALQAGVLGSASSHTSSSTAAIAASPPSTPVTFSGVVVLSTPATAPTVTPALEERVLVAPTASSQESTAVIASAPVEGITLSPPVHSDAPVVAPGLAISSVTMGEAVESRPSVTRVEEMSRAEAPPPEASPVRSAQLASQHSRESATEVLVAPSDQLTFDPQLTQPRTADASGPIASASEPPVAAGYRARAAEVAGVLSTLVSPASNEDSALPAPAASRPGEAAAGASASVGGLVPTVNEIVARPAGALPVTEPRVFTVLAEPTVTSTGREVSAAAAPLPMVEPASVAAQSPQSPVIGSSVLSASGITAPAIERSTEQGLPGHAPPAVSHQEAQRTSPIVVAPASPSAVPYQGRLVEAASAMATWVAPPTEMRGASPEVQQVRRPTVQFAPAGLPDLRMAPELVSVLPSQSATALFIDKLIGIRAESDTRSLSVMSSALEAKTAAAVSMPTIASAARRESGQPGASAPIGPTSSRFDERYAPSHERQATLAVAAPALAYLAERAVPVTREGATASTTQTVASQPEPTRAAASASLPVRTTEAVARPSTFDMPSPSPQVLPTHEAPLPALEMLRPGGIGVRTEQLAGMIGIRAAGISIDFIDPEWAPVIAEARGMSGLPFLTATSFDLQVPQAAGGMSAERVLERRSPSMEALGSQFSGEALPREGGFASQVFPGATGAAPEYTTAQANIEAVTDSPASVEGTAARASLMPRRLRPALGVVPPVASSDPVIQRRIEEVWSLIRVFPGAAPAVIASMAANLTGLSPSRPATGMTHSADPRGAAYSPSVAAAAPTRLGGAAASATSQVAATAIPAAPYGAARTAVADAAATFVSPMAVVGALDRPALPSGNVPRGSFFWSRASSFAREVGDWQWPVTTETAQMGAEAASVGLPSWNAMAPISLPQVAQAFADAERASEGHPASPRSSGAPSSRMVVPLPSTAGAAQLRAIEPFLRLVVEGGGGTTVSSSTSSSEAPAPVPFAAQSLPLIQPPTVAAQPATESSARLVEAMRSQQAPTTSRATADDRISLSDLTLVATGVVRQQIAAAGSGGRSHSPAARRRGDTAQGGHKNQNKMTPEQEQREIDELARRVIEQVQTLLDIARDRSGDPWGS